MDSLNGSSFINKDKKYVHLSNINFATSLVHKFYLNHNNLLVKVYQPQISDIDNISKTYKYFENDSIGNQMIIIVESFGLIDNQSKQSKFQESINVQFEKNGWQCEWGKTAFEGGTPNAELRELLNCKGDYRYFLNDNISNFKLSSIFSIKKRQGYFNIGVHSCVGNMFERNIWWRNIEIENAFFEEDLIIKNNFKLKLNFDTPFASVNDEDAFDYIQSVDMHHGKYFAYLLTENTHLSFNGSYKDMYPFKNYAIKDEQLSDECKNQVIRLKNLLGYFANNLDSTKWKKILIVGDHMPPYLSKAERSFYNDKFVPYCLVSH
ncbi:MAG: hypothetical protein WCI31_15890 [Prolixibacteraceae bacterium]